MGRVEGYMGRVEGEAESGRGGEVLKKGDGGRGCECGKGRYRKSKWTVRGGKGGGGLKGEERREMVGEGLKRLWRVSVWGGGCKSCGG
jgi:hypothetical protein